MKDKLAIEETAEKQKSCSEPNQAGVCGSLIQMEFVEKTKGWDFGDKLGKIDK